MECGLFFCFFLLVAGLPACLCLRGFAFLWVFAGVAAWERVWASAVPAAKAHTNSTAQQATRPVRRRRVASAVRLRGAS